MFEYAIYNEFEGTNYIPNPTTTLNFTFGRALTSYFMLAFIGVLMILTLIFLRLKAKMIN